MPYQIVFIHHPITGKDVGNAQRECAVSARARSDPPVAAGGSAAFVRIDADKLGARLFCLKHPHPQVAVGHCGVGAPVQDQPALGHRVGVDYSPPAQGDLASRRTGRGANGAVKQGGAKCVKESAVKAGALQLAHGAGVTVREDCLRAI